MVLILQREYLMPTFGKKVRQLRKERGWTQKELGEASGLSKPYISRVENDDIGFSFKAATKIAEALDRPLALLLYPDIPTEMIEEADEFLKLFARLPPDRREIAYRAVLAMDNMDNKSSQ